MSPRIEYQSNDLSASGEFGTYWTREVDTLENAKIAFSNHPHNYDMRHAVYSEYIVTELESGEREIYVINWTIGMHGEVLNNHYSHIALLENGILVEYPITLE